MFKPLQMIKAWKYDDDLNDDHDSDDDWDFNNENLFALMMMKAHSSNNNNIREMEGKYDTKNRKGQLNGWYRLNKDICSLPWTWSLVHVWSQVDFWSSH